MSFMKNGLFGLGGYNAMSAPMPQQLAGLYDPQAMRNAKIKNIMTGAGLAMLGQGPSALPINFGTSLGQGLAAGMQQAQAAEKDYRDMAYQTFSIQNDMDDRKYRREGDAMERDWRQKMFDYKINQDAAEAKRWERKFAADQQGGSGYFGTPLPLNDSSGQFAGFGLPSKDGSFKPLEPPQGMSFASPYDKAYNTKLGSETAQNAAEKKASLPKVQAASKELDMQWELVNNTIDQALADLDSGYFRTGLIGSVLGGVAGTPQYNLSQKLETIKANVGFDKLQSMRENSPTGGALGQVSDFENKLLQAVKGSLQQGQSPEVLAENLRYIKSILNEAKSYKDAAFMRDYGELIGGQQPSYMTEEKPAKTPNRLRYNPAIQDFE